MKEVPCPIELICTKKWQKIIGIRCPVREAIDTNTWTNEANNFVREQITEYVIFSRAEI